jgi:hypothetical protein
MARRTTLRSLVLAGAVGTAGLFAGGCIVETRPVVVVDSPPPRPRRHAVMAARPGFVWVDGFWANIGGRWAWRDGHWERARSGYVYVQGRWLNRAGRWHWVEPRWERGRGHVRGDVRVRGGVRRERP